MRALLLSVLLSASPPPPTQAQKLAAQRDWDELYLAWAAVKPKPYSPAERHVIASSLLKGCEALAGSDAVMAYSLADRAVVFEETVPGLRCLIRTALASDQRGAAEEALRQGLARFPKQGCFPLELGRLLLDDQDAEAALEVLRRVPPRSPEADPAQRLTSKALAMAREQKSALAQVRSMERRLDGDAPAASASRAPGLSYESGVGEDGMRTRANSRFVVKYFNNARDFGQRADYEGRIVSALDEAREHTRRVLGQAREEPVDVVLYTREEFRTHQGAALARAVAGLYSAGAIRINDAAELTPQTRATLVHEYVHAVVDDLVGATQAVPVWLDEGLAEYVEWRYQGSDKPPYSLANRLRGAAQAGQLPSLHRMAGAALIHQGDPALAYGTSAMAVRELLEQGGPGRLLELIRQVGQGASFEEALQSKYGRSVTQLDESVKAALSRR
ncbi:MAG: tetratricopeptide repeat protein [Cystobacter sp.]